MASRLMQLLTGTAGDGEERLQRGDVEAFTQLVRTHQSRIYRFCVRMLGDTEDAKDATQDIFFALHRALPRFRGESQLSTWMYRVAMNQCLNWRKSRGRRDRGHAAACSGEAEEVSVEESQGPCEQLERKRRQAKLHAALQILSEEQRVLVVLRDVEGMSYEEILEVTGLAEGTVKSRLHRARERLAAALRGEEQEEAS